MAQTGDAVEGADLAAINKMGGAVGAYVADYLSGYGDTFEPQLLVQLAAVAQQKAIAHTCDGFEVDESRYNDAMSSMLNPIIAMIEVPEDGGAAINLPFTIAMSAYSMVLGGYIAAGASDPDAMCALGNQLRDSVTEDVLIWTAAD
ncbi:MAG: hypothetical protein K9L70_09025 [Thiohalocapsa sp.]|nr:hypothetical protein [Thiohalocapsa sp.]MCF7992391.1 hypothetical protein [Thiohalocapsa sp.]